MILGQPIPRISITRLEGESDKAFQARKVFLLLGTDRTLEKVAEALGRPPSYVAQLKVWLNRFDWRQTAESYDNTIATLAAIDHAVQEQEQQAKRRARYQKAADKLMDVALAMLDQLQKHVHGLEYTPTTLAVIGRALAIAQSIESAVTPKDGLFNDASNENTPPAAAKAYVGISPDDWDAE